MPPAFIFQWFQNHCTSIFYFTSTHEVNIKIHSDFQVKPCFKCALIAQIHIMSMHFCPDLILIQQRILELKHMTHAAVYIFKCINVDR
jgi:hypothetical protein